MLAEVAAVLVGPFDSPEWDGDRIAMAIRMKSGHGKPGTLSKARVAH